MTLSETTSSRASVRIGWLDIARGVALVAMASYHLMWDLSTFGYLEPGYAAGGWPKLYARAIASTFLFLAGFSLALAHRDGIKWDKFWKRWFVIAGAAMLVTVASYFAIPQGLIHFGILHAIAAASLIGLVFLRAPSLLTFAVALACYVAPLYLKSETFNTPWLWWVGLSTEPRQSFDYVPLLPWLAPVLLGMGTARIPAIAGWLRQNASVENRPGTLGRPFAYLGRHSLVFYLVHQPVLITILYGISLAAPAPGHPEAFVRDCVAACLPQGNDGFCKRYCDCALDGLEKGKLLAPLQSGTMPEAYRVQIDDIRSQCTAKAEPSLHGNGN